MMRWLRATVTLGIVGLAANRGRAAYLVVTLAVTVAAWLVLSAFTQPFLGSSNSGDSGITIRNASPNAPLPLRYAQRIEAVTDAHGVVWYGLQMVSCGAATAVTLNAIGGPGIGSFLAQKQVAGAVQQRWLADPLGAIVSADALSKCGWHIGQGVQPPGFMGQHFDLHVVGTFPGSAPIAFTHYDYINRAGPGFQGRDMVLWYLARAGDPRHDELLAARVEMEFAHDFPAVSATANATQQNAWARFGKAEQLLVLVMAAVLLCAASVLVSVLAHTAAQRRPGFAVLQVLGFQRTTLFAAFALELMASVATGAVLGVLLAHIVGRELATTDFGALTGGAPIPSWAWSGLPAWLAGLALVSLAWPAGLIARTRPADYRAI